jgi:hypothetical protein
MDIAKRLHQCLTNGTSVHDLLDIYLEINGKDTLALVNEYFLEQYNMTPQEYITEKFGVDVVYAFSSTLKCIREPSEKNIRIRNKFYEKIGHAIPTAS